MYLVVQFIWMVEVEKHHHSDNIPAKRVNYRQSRGGGTGRRGALKQH